MPTQKPHLKVYLDQETLEKFSHIAKKERRSASNKAAVLIEEEIATYEAEHGTITNTKTPDPGIKVASH